MNTEEALQKMKVDLAQQLREEMRQEREQIRQEQEEMSLERQSMMEAFDKRLETLLVSQKFPNIVEPDLSHGVARVNTKGSCSVAIETGGDIDFGSQCEMYTLVDYVSPPQLVAMGSALKVQPCYMGNVSPLT